MPFKSQAQRRKFAEMVKDGKISKETFGEWNSETPKKIPERIGPQKKINSIEQLREKVRGGKK